MACIALTFAISAPAAFAAKGVYDAFGTNGAKGGEFGAAGGGISGVAVNSSGAGAAEEGDVYVLDRGNNRIQRFDADGAFISAFGQDVVESGPGNNGTGYEICKAASGDVCKAGIPGGTGGAFNFASSLAISGIAVNQTSGDLYVTDRANRRVQQFDGEGNFIRTWGHDVISSGAGDSAANEQQTVTVRATSGTFTLTFSGQTATAIPFNATAAELEAKLNALSSIGGAGGSVTVSGGPGDATGTVPYVVTFGGVLGGDEVAQMTSSAAGLLGGVPSSAAAIATPVQGGAFEICEVAANCKAATEAVTGGAFHEFSLNSLAIAPLGAPNAGNVLVADGGNRRVQEFTASGAFVRAFGHDVVASGPGNTGIGFEVCNAAALDVCQDGTAGSSPGQFTFSSLTSLAEDSSGNIYTTEFNNNFRVQKFTLPGNVVTPGGEFDPAELKGSGAWNAVGKEDTPIAVAVDTSTAPGTPGTVYVLKYFRQGSGAPPLEKKEARILEVDPVAEEVTDEFMVRAEVGTGVMVTALALNTATERLYVAEPTSNVLVVDEVPPLAVAVDPAEAAATNAILKATITPAPLPNLHTFYRFEYAREGTGEWKRLPVLPAPDIDIGKGPAPVAVFQKAEGLEISACYDVKAIAYSKYRGAEGEAAGTFCTKPIPPQVKTGQARWSSPAATNPSLTLSGTINPGKDQTAYFFQYVTEEQFEASGFAAPSQVPALPAAAGHGLFDVKVLQTTTGLDPTKTYVYRLVATNSVGSEVGAERTVAPPDPSARFYELVSDSDSFGLEVASILAVSDDGQRSMVQAQAMGDPNTLPAQRTPFLARRGNSSWGIDQVNPFPEAGKGELNFVGTAWFPSDLSTALWSHSSPGEQIRGEVHWTFTDPGAPFRTALPKLVPVTGRATRTTATMMKGAAADLSSFVFQREEKLGTHVTYLPGQPTTTGGDGEIYRVSGAGGPSPTLSLVNRDEAGSLISNSCGVWVGSRKGVGAGNPGAANKGMNLRPVSADGKATYFSARPSGTTSCNEATDRIRIFKRIEDTSTVEVSKSQCTRTVPTPCSTANSDDFFQGASANGNRAFFTTTRQLTDSDEDATADLYLYDSDPPAGQPSLVQASAGVVGPEHPQAGKGAEMPEGGGTADGGVVDVSVDGSRVYFLAKGQLAAGAVKGNNNLYVYQRDAAHPSGRIGFVAKLDVSDSGLWGVAGRAATALPGDGRYLLFAAQTKLLPAVDTDPATDLYRYDDETSTTICLTCDGNGNFGVSVRGHGPSQDPAGAQRDRFASEDLTTVAFSSAEKLLPADENTLPDAYIWEEGNLELASTGDPDSNGVAGQPLLSADGSAAFFLTADRILPSDNDSAVDAYSARVGGGFPEVAATVSCISADECRTAPVHPPAPPAVSTPPTTGNPPQAKPRPKCQKPKVRKKGRCVKPKRSKKAGKHKKATRHRANNDRRAGK